MPTRAVLIALVLSVPTPAALAVVAAKTPPSVIYNNTANVVVARITRVSPDTGVIEAAATPVKGQSPAPALKVKIENLPAATAGLKEGDPMVFFLSGRGSRLHVNDVWVRPEAAAPGNFVVRKDEQAALRQSYPGTTAALVRIVEELKANNGKSSMLDATHVDMFKGGTKQIPPDAKLPAPAVTTATGHFADDPQLKTTLTLKDGNLLLTTDHAASPTADFTRLTGEPVAPYAQRLARGATLAPLDANGDGRTDVMINAPEGGGGPLLLVNRGFGCFFIIPDLNKTLGDHFPPGANWTAMDVDQDKHDDLVVIKADGTATAILNPPPPK